MQLLDKRRNLKPGGVNTIVFVQVEHVGALGLVVHLAPPLRLLLTDHLTNVLGDELVLSRLLPDVATPAGKITGGHI